MMNVSKERIKTQINRYESKINFYEYRLTVMDKKYHKEIERKLATYYRYLKMYQEKLAEIA